MNIPIGLQQIADEMIPFRHDLHRHPETAHEEMRTSQKVIAELEKADVEFVSGWGKTPETDPRKGGHAIVAILKGTATTGDHERSLMFRADMDALNISEESGVEHASTISGKMHACGHDGHPTQQLIALKYLAARRDQFAGTIYFNFQTAEESGEGGARFMVEEGLLEQYEPDFLIGMHNWPGMPLGKIAVHEEHVMAGSYYYDVELTGQGAHAGQMREGVSALKMATEIVESLPKSNDEGPVSTWQTVETTYIHAGVEGQRTAKPGKAYFSGTVRVYNAELAEAVGDHLKQQCDNTNPDSIVSKFGGSAEVKFWGASPPTVNSPEAVQFMRAVSENVVGEENVDASPKPAGAAEDFGHYVKRIREINLKTKASFIWVGQGDPDDENSPHNSPLHDPKYDYNDAALALQASVTVEAVKHYFECDFD